MAGLILFTVTALAFSLAATAAIVIGVHRARFAARLADSNDVASFFATAVATVYAVVLAFMLFAVWTRFDGARSLAEQEAASLLTICRLAGGLPAAQRATVQTAAMRYAQAAIDREWPAMARATESAEVDASYEGLWSAVLSTRASDNRSQTLFDQMLTRLASVGEYRRLRLLTSHSGLPDLLWVLLIVGAVITVATSAFFGVKSVRIHLAQAASLTTILVLTLVALGELDGPFNGYVRVDPHPFEDAVRVIQERSH